MAAVMTLGVVVSITIYALSTNQDYTMWGGLVFVFLTVFFLSILFFFILPFENTWEYSRYNSFVGGLGAFLASFYIIYDTQLIAGGKRFEITMDDYIIGALILYIDIIRLFLYIL